MPKICFVCGEEKEDGSFCLTDGKSVFFVCKECKEFELYYNDGEQIDYEKV